MSVVGQTGAAPAPTLGGTLEAVLDQVRRLFQPTGCAFLIVDGEPRRIEPAASWFSSPEVAAAMTPVLRRAYDPRHPGLTELAIEEAAPLVLRDVESWAGAAALRSRLADRLDPDAAEVAWEWYRRSCFLACPVRTAAGRVLGVLAAAMRHEHAVGEDEMRAMQALADLAAVAVERAKLLDREAARAREELLLKEAAREMPASLELADVHRAIVHHAERMSEASGVVLEALEPSGDELRVVAVMGSPAEPVGRRVPLDGDRAAALAERRGVARGRTVVVPIALGRRAFGVLTAHLTGGEAVAAEDLRRLEALAPLAAGAIANATEFAEQRRVARALARGFVPSSPPELASVEFGVIYYPAELTGGGGDFFGVWPLRRGGTAVLVGDVSGKGLEVSASSAMTRFFVEARTWDCDAPAAALSQVNALLCGRGGTPWFATAFLAILADGRLRYANAGHVPPLVRRRDGALEELPASGMPLAVDADATWGEAETGFGPGDLLFAATDGLVEARRDGMVLGEEPVRRLVAAQGGSTPPQELVERAHRLALEWASQVRDDIVVVAVRAR